MKKEIEITEKVKGNIAKRFSIVVFITTLASYIFKVCGSEIFNKFVENETLNAISQTIDGNYVLNILCYSLLGYIITQFVFCTTCKSLKLKWYDYIVIILFSLVMSVLRFYFVGTITYLFDLIQYIFIPTVYGAIIKKTNIIDCLMNTLILYFVSTGIMFINKTLCDLVGLIYYNGFASYVLCFIEIYTLIISISIFIISEDN